MAKKKTKHQRFAAAAKELNKVLGIEPPIKTKGIKTEDLGEKLLEAKTLLYEEDEISKETEKVLNFLSAKATKEDEVEEPEEKEETEEEVAEETEEEEDEVDEEEVEEAEEAEGVDRSELKEKVIGASKRKQLLQIAMGEEFFEPLENDLPKLKSVKALKSAMLELFDAEDEDEAASEKSKPKKSSGKKKKAPKKKKSSKKEEKVEEAEEAEEAEEEAPEEKPKKKKKKKSGKKSNKAIVYEAWDDGEKDPETLHGIIDEAVKLSTVKSWVNAWDKGKNLPAIAK